MEKGFDELTIADDIAKQCTSMYILGLRVCNANLLLHRTTAVHGGIDTSSIFSSNVLLLAKLASLSGKTA